MNDPVSKWLDFNEIERKTKTSVWEVKTKTDGSVLGLVKWHAPWRQYCFFPADYTATIFSRSCLNDIVAFIEKLMQQRMGAAFFEIEGVIKT